MAHDGREGYPALGDWGWDGRWAEAFAGASPDDGEEPARVTAQERGLWTVETATGAVATRLGRGAAVPPAVGDWVILARDPSDPASGSMVAVLARRSAFLRGTAGSGATPQVLAANVDVTWIVHGLDVPPNLRRIERYLAVAWESGSVPAVVLTKADLAEDLEGAVAATRSVAPGSAVWPVSTADPASVAALRASLAPTTTVALLGPSGVGKSTLVNALVGSGVAATGDVRAGDRKGRHTTTRRELFPLPGGGLVMDTPGLRELRVWTLDEGLEGAFPEIEALASGCRFRDCRHEMEPGCAVLRAVEAGDLERDRFESYRKLRAEAAREARKSDPRAEAARVAEHKTALKTMRYHPKRQKGG